MPLCPRCQRPAIKQDGHPAPDTQRHRCLTCRRTFTQRTGTPFAGYRWPQEIIITAVRWSCPSRLSAANVRDLLAERGIDVSARTILSWVHPVGPQQADLARRLAPKVGRRWWADETYVRVRGRWADVYRAVDEDGQVMDVLRREHRDLASATAFFRLAIERRGVAPSEVITDGHAADPRAVREEAPGARHRVTGRHRADGHATTQPVERSQVPAKDRRRAIRGRESIGTGQRLVEGMTLAQAGRRGDVSRSVVRVNGTAGPHERAREAVATFRWLAGELRLAS